jgi:hypothetical protein
LLTRSEIPAFPPAALPSSAFHSGYSKSSQVSAAWPSTTTAEHSVSKSENEPTLQRPFRVCWEIKPSLRLSAEERQLIKQENNKERERTVKWVAMLGSDSNEREFRVNRPKHSAEYERRILKSIPNSCRGRAYFQMLVSKNSGCKNQPTVDELCQMPDRRNARLIQNDMSDVLPHVVFFTQNSICDSLYRVLRAYSIIDPTIEYYTGMAFNAGLLLSYMNEQKAF